MVSRCLVIPDQRPRSICVPGGLDHFDRDPQGQATRDPLSRIQGPFDRKQGALHRLQLFRHRHLSEHLFKARHAIPHRHARRKHDDDLHVLDHAPRTTPDDGRAHHLCVGEWAAAVWCSDCARVWVREHD